MQKQFERVTHLFVSPRWVLTGGALLLIAMFSICAVILWDGRQDAFGRAQDGARNTMLVIERDIARNIQIYDLSLQAVVEGIHDPRVTALPPDMRRGYLFDRAANAEFLGAVFVLDSNGNIVLDSRKDDPARRQFRRSRLLHGASRHARTSVSTSAIRIARVPAISIRASRSRAASTIPTARLAASSSSRCNWSTSTG